MTTHQPQHSQIPSLYQTQSYISLQTQISNLSSRREILALKQQLRKNAYKDLSEANRRGLSRSLEVFESKHQEAKNRNEVFMGKLGSVYEGFRDTCMSVNGGSDGSCKSNLKRDVKEYIKQIEIHYPSYKTKSTSSRVAQIENLERTRREIEVRRKYAEEVFEKDLIVAKAVRDRRREVNVSKMQEINEERERGVRRREVYENTSVEEGLTNAEDRGGSGSRSDYGQSETFKSVNDYALSIGMTQLEIEVFEANNNKTSLVDEELALAEIKNQYLDPKDVCNGSDKNESVITAVNEPTPQNIETTQTLTSTTPSTSNKTQATSINNAQAVKFQSPVVSSDSFNSVVSTNNKESNFKTVDSAEKDSDGDSESNSGSESSSGGSDSSSDNGEYEFESSSDVCKGYSLHQLSNAFTKLTRYIDLNGWKNGPNLKYSSNHKIKAIESLTNINSSTINTSSTGTNNDKSMHTTIIIDIIHNNRNVLLPVGSNGMNGTCLKIYEAITKNNKQARDGTRELFISFILLIRKLSDESNGDNGSDSVFDSVISLFVKDNGEEFETKRLKRKVLDFLRFLCTDDVVLDGANVSVADETFTNSSNINNANQSVRGDKSRRGNKSFGNVSAAMKSYEEFGDYSSGDDEEEGRGGQEGGENDSFDDEFD